MKASFYFQGKGWQNFIEVKLRYWNDFYKMWIEGRKHTDIKILFYEDMKINIVNEVLEILDFIGFEADSDRLDCLEKIQFRTFKRNKSKNKIEKQNCFSASQKFLIAKHVKMLNRTLVQNKHEGLPKSYLDFTEFGKIIFQGKSR